MKLVWLLVGPLVLSVLGIGTATAVGAVDGSTRVSPAAEHSAPVTLGGLWTLATAQPLVPGPVLIARSSRHKDAKGTRSDEQLFEISRTGSNDVPDAALRAYHRAEKLMAQENPGCQISWTLLAAIGRVESNHGRFAGAQLGSDGVSRPEIRGPQLDGAGPFAAIHDSDNGILDHDKVWDRAVGQMQFLPETWAAVARDGDGDGRKNPDDIDDSALGSAVYLCGAGGSLAEQAGMARAAFRYNHSDYYVQLVLSFTNGYETGVFSVPSPPPPPKADAKSKHKVQKPAKVRHVAKPRPARPAKPVAPSTPKPSAAPKPEPAPKPTPAPKPSPTPAGPRLDRVDGIWQACGPAFCLGSTVLDLGPMNVWNDHAEADFDGDHATESNVQEFAGLVGKHVNLQVEKRGGAFVVYVIGGDGYRNADGSFARAQLAGATPAP